MKFLYPPRATSIDPDEAAGLIPAHLVLQMNSTSLMNEAVPLTLSRENL